jgi:DNA repair photolyase
MKRDYCSPRWTQEILDCSMPMTFDVYGSCSYNCLYCFAYYQKAQCLGGYQSDVRSVDPASIVRLFKNTLAGRFSNATRMARQFAPYILSRKVMQIGALADQFDENERRHGVTLALLRFFDMIDYPLSFSTKAVWWTQDPRYMALFARHRHNWHVKVSVITADKSKARHLEAGCPTPMQRIDAIRRLSDIGVSTTLRLRPFLIGASEDWPELINLAAAAGAKSVTTEWFCMEARAAEPTKERYRKMSSIIGFDVWSFYMENSRQHGYKRLNKGLKLPVVRAMSQLAHEKGMRFNVSDAHCREFNDHPNCCGVPPEWNSQAAHFGGAILTAKTTGVVRFSDISSEVGRLFPFRWLESEGYNTGTNRARAVALDMTMAQFFRANWNDSRRGACPANMYSCLQECGVDESRDVIYRYSGDA